MRKYLFFLALLSGLSSSAVAGSATWLTNPMDGEWDTAANWTQGGPPNGVSDVATFRVSDLTEIAVSEKTGLDGILFQAGASSYTLTIDQLDLAGFGITNDSENMQAFILGFGGNHGGSIALENGARIGSNTSFAMGGEAGDGGGIFFFENSNAGDGIFNLSACDHLAWGGALFFGTSSSAGRATIVASGSSVRHCPVGQPGCSNPYPQGTVFFQNASTAGNATLIAQPGIGDGSPGAIFFVHSSSGDRTRIELLGNSYLDMSQHNAPGLTLGSLEGEGTVYVDTALPSYEPVLTIGSNNLSTTFSGVFVNLLDEPSSGSITKIGTGTFTISRNQTYFGITTVDGGRLNLNASISRDIVVNDGATLGGSGTARNVTVHDGGTFAPGSGGQPFHILFGLDRSALLRFEVANADPIASRGLDIGADAEVGGTLEVRFMNGFIPQSGQTFKLFHVGGQFRGTFSRVIFPDLRNGFQFQSEFSNGDYQVTALNDAVPASGFLNISTRMRVDTDENVLIAGFIVASSTGSASGDRMPSPVCNIFTTHLRPNGNSKRVLLRAIGPSLMADKAEALPDRLADPTLELHDSTGALLSFNDNWRQGPQAQEIKESGIPPTDDLEAAIIADLDPGRYTVIMRGAEQTSGIGVVEAYDLARENSAQLANISTRGFVQTGDGVMIGGFIVDNHATPVLVRAIGPSLASSGVSNSLTDPILELHDGQGQLIDFNDDWPDTHEGAIAVTGIPPTDSKESALLETLSPGAYTAIVRGKNETTGVGLIEVYDLR